MSQRMKRNISKQQKEVLVDFLSKKPEMYCGKFTPTYTRARCQALWSELATILNSMPEGANKNWEAWRKTWIDLKKNKKAKLAVIRKHCQGTGGGPPLLEIPEEKTFEDKIFDMLTPVAVEGNEEVAEPSLLDEVETLGSDLENEILEYPESNNIKNEASLQQQQPITTSPANITTQANRTPVTRGITTKKVKRVTKTARLTESIKNHSKLLTISQQGIDETREYRAEKLQILREHYKNKENLQRQQNMLLEKICSRLGELEFQSME